MKEYDLIVIGSGSAMNYVGAMMEEKPDMKVAVIDKDDPGGICLTRGCIPSKMLLYPAELVRDVGRASKFGIDVDIKDIDFRAVMENMRHIITEDIEMIREGLSADPAIDYYPQAAEFVSPYTLKVGDETITSEMIFLCTGSKPLVPPVEGLDEVGYLTSDNVLEMDELPGSIAIIGAGYIGAEYGHFFSAMGSKVTIIGRGSRLVPEEEPEVSALAKKKMSEYMDIITNHAVFEVQETPDGMKKVLAKNRETDEVVEVVADEILVATGRGPNTDILNPTVAGIETDSKGWIKVNKYLETSQPNIWAFGDANGKYLFKHVGNYESGVVYYNAVQKRDIEVDYHAIPSAVFSYPEMASVGMLEKDAINEFGADNVLIGFQMFEDTAKGLAMKLEDYFVKVILEADSRRILGAHIIGPHASVLIHQIIPMMYTHDQSAIPLMRAMDIHPSLSEVVKRAFSSIMPPEHYHHVLEHMGLGE